MYQDKKNPCYVGFLRAFQPSFRVTKNSPLKPQNVAENSPKTRRDFTPPFFLLSNPIFAL